MKHYLVEFDRRSGEASFTEFDAADDAIQARLEREAMMDGSDVEVVVVGSPSIEKLLITHSRYFPGMGLNGEELESNVRVSTALDQLRKATLA